MSRTASVVWSVIEIIGALFLMFIAAVLIIVGIEFATDVSHNLDGDLGRGIFSWLIAIAMTFIAIVMYRHSIRRLHSLPMAWSVVEIILAGFLLLCAGFRRLFGLWNCSRRAARVCRRRAAWNGFLADGTGHDHHRHCFVQAFEPTGALAMRATSV